MGLFKSTHLGYDPGLIRAKLSFKSVLPNQDFLLGEQIRVKTFQLNHQGVTLSYRIEYQNHSAIIVTDHAPVTSTNLMGEGMKDRAVQFKDFPARFQADFLTFLKSADLVIFDTHFTEANLKMDWATRRQSVHLRSVQKQKSKLLPSFTTPQRTAMRRFATRSEVSLSRPGKKGFR